VQHAPGLRSAPAAASRAWPRFATSSTRSRTRTAASLAARDAREPARDARHFTLALNGVRPRPGPGLPQATGHPLPAVPVFPPCQTARERA